LKYLFEHSFSDRHRFSKSSPKKLPKFFLNPIFTTKVFSGGVDIDAIKLKRLAALRTGTDVMQPYSETPAIGGIPLPAMDCSADDLFRMGMLYSTGQGGMPLDYVSAHMMFNLAAMRGSLEAKIYRKELSQEMDHADVAEAQRAAREWLNHAGWSQAA
jgi:uncharacterized protein